MAGKTYRDKFIDEESSDEVPEKFYKNTLNPANLDDAAEIFLREFYNSRELRKLGIMSKRRQLDVAAWESSLEEKIEKKKGRMDDQDA